MPPTGLAYVLHMYEYYVFLHFGLAMTQCLMIFQQKRQGYEIKLQISQGLYKYALMIMIAAS